MYAPGTSWRVSMRVTLHFSPHVAHPKHPEPGTGRAENDTQHKFSDLRKYGSKNHFPTIWPGRRCSAPGVSLMPARDSKRSQLSSWPRRVTQTTPLWSRIIPQCPETIQEPGIGLEFFLGVWIFFSQFRDAYNTRFVILTTSLAMIFIFGISLFEPFFAENHQ